jgi:lipooligosaccharide transport system permease protein
LLALVLPRLVGVAGTGRRSAAVAARNVSALRSGPAYWLVIASGFFEPLLYLFSIGIGVGALIGDLTLPDGRTVAYSAFVAPGMLAASAMGGALTEAFNFYAKTKYIKLYDGVLATPVRPIEIALGELSWAMFRGAIYSSGFLVVMVAMGLTTAGWALLAFPASLLVGVAFGGLGMALATFMRSWQDFDLFTSVQFALFLFSGTFVPPESYPAALRVVVELTPLYHSVELIRAITTGSPGLASLGHAGYLAALAVLGLAVAGRRMGTLLLK